MDGGQNNDIQSGNFQSADVLSGAPPPPTEVKVRTMHSDLESIAKTGGDLPKFQNIKVQGLSSQKQEADVIARAKGRNNAWIILIIIAAVAILGFLGWLAYGMYAQNTAPSANTLAPGEPQPNTAETTTQPIASPPASPQNNTPPASFTHQSVFKKPADQVLTFMSGAGGTSQGATDLQTYSQKLLALLNSAKKSATLLEIDAKGTDGKDLGVNELLAQANAQIINPQFLSMHFRNDATFFVYQDANGFWPGYVITPNLGENWLYLQSDIQKLESSPNIANLFLINAGVPSSDGFTDSTISGTPVRVLPLMGGTIPAYFVYGWAGNHAYMILCTSQNGFAAAMARL